MITPEEMREMADKLDETEAWATEPPISMALFAALDGKERT